MQDDTDFEPTRRSTLGAMAGVASVLASTAALARPDGPQAVSDREAAARFAARLGVLMDRQWDHLQWVARSVEEFWPPTSREELRFILDTAHDNAPHIIWIGVATVNDGRVLAATRGIIENVDVTQRPWFIEGTRHNAAVDVHDALLLQVALNRDPSQGMLRLIDFVSPVRDVGGTIVAMIGSHLLWEWVLGLLRAETPPPGGELALVSARGEVLAGPPGAQQRLADAVIVPVRQREDVPSFGWQIAVVR